MKPTLQPYVRGKPQAPVVQASPARPDERKMDRGSKDEEGMRTLSRTTGNDQLHQAVPAQKAPIQIADYGKVELNKLQKDPYTASRN